MTVSLRPALSSLINTIRGSSQVDSGKLERFQKPVARVNRRPAGFADGFDGAPAKSPRLAAAQNATPAPRPGVTTATHLHRDGFDVAARKPVELAPKLAPRMAAVAKARVNVMRF